MKLINAIDESVLSFFTRISHWFQRLTGRTSFFLAKIAFTFASMDLVLVISNFWLPILWRKTSFLSVLVGFIMVGIFYKLLRECDASDASLLNDPKAIDNRFSRRMLTMDVRLLTLLGSLGSMLTFSDVFREYKVLYFEIFHRFGVVFFLCGAYFLSVIPLPPGKSKIAEWANSIRAYLMRPVAVPSGSAGK